MGQPTVKTCCVPCVVVNGWECWTHGISVSLFPRPSWENWGIFPGVSGNETGVSVSLVPRSSWEIVPGGSGNETGMSAEVGLYVHEVAGSYLMMKW